MTRVIAVQEEQLKTLRENYSKNLQSNILVQNNANILSESLDTNVTASRPIDMESQSVNMNAFSSQPISPVISSEATSEVFGSSINSQVSIVENPISAVSEVEDLKDGATTSNEDNDLPYQEPALSNSSPINVMSDEAFVNYINSLRNMLSDFMNDMNSKLDKLQEEFLSKTGANLLSTESIIEKKGVEPVSVQTLESPINFDINTPVSNIFDADKTFVTNDLMQDITDARNEMENSMSKAA